MDFRRLLFASILSLAVVVLWPVMFPSLRQPVDSPATPAAETAGEAPTPTPAAGGPSPAAGEPTPTAAGAEAPPAPAAAAELAPPPPPLPEIVAAAAERIVVETASLRAEIDNDGGVLRSVVAKRQVSGREEREELVRDRGAGPYPFAVVDGGGQRLDGGLFVVERSREGDAEVVSLALRSGGRAFEKRFVFPPAGAMQFDIRAEGVAAGWGVWLGPGLRNLSQEEAESRFTRRLGVYRDAEGVETVEPKDADEEDVVVGPVRWAGLEDTYFLGALIGDEPFARARYREALVTADAGGEAPTGKANGKDLGRDLSLVVEPSGERLAGRAYFGAKVLERLEAEGVGLENTVRWGGWGFLAIPLLHGLEWLHDNVVGNYGWAIVLMTVAIRLVLLPLTHKSYVSMQKMAALNPKMQAIRNAYRGKMRDKHGRVNLEAQQKMNQEIMALYQREGVNPMGGCLPMLLQFPVLLAFYSLLSTAVELKGAPWIAWIADLAARDPHYVLPLVMGATQFLQTKMTPMTGDPLQRKIFLALPVVFTVLFLGFPSGLVLYWLTSNILTIFQTVVYNRLRAKKA